MSSNVAPVDAGVKAPTPTLAPAGTLTVLAHPRVACPGDTVDPAGAQAIKADEALTQAWPTDAHCTAYAPVSIELTDGTRATIRLRSDMIGEAPIVMRYAIGDLDDEAAHAEHRPASDAWRAEVEPRLEGTGLLWYRTRGGARVVGVLAEPIAINTRADAAAWKARYHAWRAELEAAHGLKLDKACADWTRLFRLPNVQRDGRAERAEVHGGASPMVALPAAPSAALAPRKAPAPAPAPMPPAAIRAQVGSVVAAVAPHYLPGVRHTLGRAVAGYLRHKDWPQAAAIDALQEIADAAGSDDAAARARVVWAYSAENPDGASTLRDWPDLLAALDAATRGPLVAELRARADARAERALATVPADDALEIPEFTPGRGNAPAPTHANVLALLAVVGDRVRLESFTGRIVVAGMPPEAGHFPDGEWADACTTEFTALCERRGLNVGRQTVAASVVAHARRREYNALTELAQRLAAGWDGTPRVDGSMARYWGAAPGAAAVAVARVFMLSLAARALRPGVKVDTCPVLIGPQGTFKSQALRALVGDALFSDSPLPIGTGDKDAMQVLRGTWLWELAEGVGLTRQDRNAVKAFLSSQADKFRASYGQFPELVPRQTCFVASTNEVEMLNDPTGARRFLPVQVGVTRPIDVAGVTADRAQLLGEAAHRVLAGEPHWPSPAEEAALGGAREAATEADPWEGPIAAWAHRNGTPDGATVSHIAECALGIAPGRLGKPEQARIAAALRGLGWTKRQAGRDRVRTWFPPVA